MKRKIQKIKESYQVVIPKHFAEMVGIKSGTTMDIEYENEKIVMTPIFTYLDVQGKEK